MQRHVIPLVLFLAACSVDEPNRTRDAVTDAAPPSTSGSLDLPALDLAAPKEFETATFALG